MQMPYEGMPQLKVAHEVAYNGFTLPLPPALVARRPALAAAIRSCWVHAPEERPTFDELTRILFDKTGGD
jgi:hypothetical protein